MKKIKKVLRYITFGLLFIFILMVVYFSFFNKETKYIFNESLRVDKDYQWVLTNMNNKVKDEDVSKFYPVDDVLAANSSEVTREEAQYYKNLTLLEYPFSLHEGCLYTSLALADTHDIDVLLIAANSISYKFRIRSVGESTNKKICYKDLNKGKYHIYVSDNGDKYDTSQFIIVE